MLTGYSLCDTYLRLSVCSFTGVLGKACSDMDMYMHVRRIGMSLHIWLEAL